MIASVSKKAVFVVGSGKVWVGRIGDSYRTIFKIQNQFWLI